MHLLLLIRHRLGTEPTAVTLDIVKATEEGGMTMQLMRSVSIFVRLEFLKSLSFRVIGNIPRITTLLKCDSENKLMQGGTVDMKRTYINFSILWLVPLSVEQQILGITELLDLLRVKIDAVGYSKGMVIRDIVLIDPLRYFVLVSVFDITTKATEISAVAERRSTALFPALGEVLVSRRGRRKPL
jgi:hypothetical protein